MIIVEYWQKLRPAPAIAYVGGYGISGLQMAEEDLRHCGLRVCGFRTVLRAADWLDGLAAQDSRH